MPRLEVVNLMEIPTRRTGMYGGQRDLRPDEVTQASGVPVTTPVRTAIDLASLRALADRGPEFRRTFRGSVGEQRPRRREHARI